MQLFITQSFIKELPKLKTVLKSSKTKTQLNKEVISDFEKEIHLVVDYISKTVDSKAESHFKKLKVYIHSFLEVSYILPTEREVHIKLTDILDRTVICHEFRHWIQNFAKVYRRYSYETNEYFCIPYEVDAFVYSINYLKSLGYNKKGVMSILEASCNAYKDSLPVKKYKELSHIFNWLYDISETIDGTSLIV